ncbi:hypothetical protein TeGR_g7843 [Tetraparma gracilis]|uniref:C2HC zinc finger plants domain-containing protein n=1 Tax=Tetraparma gracilis TaxID=2962635 RepID=A0ABQ6MYQ4_9STRA|nr:hypothetical protein TeGR_g7843 [Tetraparma gracilis]
MPPPTPHITQQQLASAFDASDPMGSLSQLLSAVQMSHGPAGVAHVMDRIKNSISAGVSASDNLRVAEEALARMLRESRESCVLGEASPAKANSILEAAYRDGSSVICKNCGGLIKRERWANHVDYWCGKDGDGGSGDDGSGDEFEDAKMEED